MPPRRLAGEEDDDDDVVDSDDDEDDEEDEDEDEEDDEDDEDDDEDEDEDEDDDDEDEDETRTKRMRRRRRRRRTTDLLRRVDSRPRVQSIRRGAPASTHFLCLPSRPNSCFAHLVEAARNRLVGNAKPFQHPRAKLQACLHRLRRHLDLAPSLISRTACAGSRARANTGASGRCLRAAATMRSAARAELTVTTKARACAAPACSRNSRRAASPK